MLSPFTRDVKMKGIGRWEVEGTAIAKNAPPSSPPA